MRNERILFYRESLPAYPLGWYVALFAIPLCALLYQAPRILNLLPVRDTPLSRALFTFISFLFLICVLLPNFGHDPSYLFWGIAYAGILGIIDGLKAYKLDMAFVTDKSVLKEAKIAKLSAISDKWFKGITLLTGLLIAGAVSGSIHLATYNPTFYGRIGSTYANTALAIEILFLTPGIAVGIFLNVFQKINEIEAQYEKIKVD